MIIKVKVITRAKLNRVKEEGESLKVYVTSPPVKGRANEVLVETLSEHFGIKKKDIRVLRGHKSKVKLVEVSCRN